MGPRSRTCRALFFMCVAARTVRAFCPPTNMGMVGPSRININKSGTTLIMKANSALQGSTRADAIKIVGATISGAMAIKSAPCFAASRTKEELVRLLGQAKNQLDPVDKLIEDAKWDAIRNIIKTSPLADIKNVIAELARQTDDDESALLLGLRQDVLDHVQYLDSFSYNNVFVGEERRILGTKVDFDTPRMELRQAREAFDIIIEVLPPVDGG
ncbi:unnamed protein product [Scytosiphon promiscuus]